jgi:uncharacterized protein (DUF433 family)
MDWKAYIGSDPTVLLGKPVVKGTRISVEFLLDLTAEGWSRDQILSNYPSLTAASPAAAFAYARHHLV